MLPLHCICTHLNLSYSIGYKWAKVTSTTTYPPSHVHVDCIEDFRLEWHLQKTRSVLCMTQTKNSTHRFKPWHCHWFQRSNVALRCYQSCCHITIFWLIFNSVTLSSSVIAVITSEELGSLCLTYMLASPHSFFSSPDRESLRGRQKCSRVRLLQNPENCSYRKQTIFCSRAAAQSTSPRLLFIRHQRTYSEDLGMA